MEVSGKQISCFDTTVQIRSAKGSSGLCRGRGVCID